MDSESNTVKKQNTGITENIVSTDYEKPDAIVDINKLVPVHTPEIEEWFLAELLKYIRPYLDSYPVPVIKKGDYYEIVEGYRRWKAAQIAGFKEIPIVIRKKSRRGDEGNE